jgi:hypothetical protein
MLDVPIANNQVVTVQVAQTTFAVLTMPGKQFRVDFINKAEARLKPGMRGEFSSYLAHPLLLRYNSRLAEVYINSRPPDPEGLFAEIRELINAAFRGWRDWSCVLSSGEKQLQKNLIDGSGLLLPGAPAIIAKAVIEACTAHGASTYVRGSIENTPFDKPPFHLLLIGKGYVIAKEFRFTELSKEKPPLPSQ